jgi:AcrR family transcriptional regulator
VVNTLPGQKKTKRVSKLDWLEKALVTLERDGINAVKIEHLAKEFKVSRSGFYWHFKNRQGLIRSMVEYWGEEYTSRVMANSKVLNAKPKERLYNIMEMILENDLTRLDLQMRIIAEKDPVAWEMVDQVYQKRLAFLRSTFSEMGFEGEELEMRTHLFVCYHTWEGVMFRDLSKASRVKWLKLRVELLCSSPNKTD